LAFSDRIGITQPTTILLDIETDHNQHQPAGLYQLKSCRKLLLVGVAAFIVVAIIIVARY
jgi:hypothetical protein